MHQLLATKRILVVEDEYLLAVEVQGRLEAVGASVVGPVPDLRAALAQVRCGEHIDAAVLDTDIRGGKSFEVAELLRERGIPFVFASSYGSGEIPASFRSVPNAGKDVTPRDVARLLDSAVLKKGGEADEAAEPDVPICWKMAPAS